jgi:hypothetical protein
MLSCSLAILRIFIMKRLVSVWLVYCHSLRVAGLLSYSLVLSTHSAYYRSVVTPPSLPSSGPAPTRGGDGGLQCNYYGKDGM